eukprot:6748459-Prymnesium_polylepis.1
MLPHKPYQAVSIGTRRLTTDISTALNYLRGIRNRRHAQRSQNEYDSVQNEACPSSALCRAAAAPQSTATPPGASAAST